MADGKDECIGDLNEATIARLACLPEMEWRTSVLRVILSLSGRVDENTEITADTQEVLNRDVLVKVSEMYDIFDTARKFFIFLGKMGTAGMWCLETGGKLAKPALWVLAFCAACLAWWKTGSFAFPNWHK